MPEENMNLELRYWKIDKIRNYLTEEMNQNELMCERKYKNVCRALHYIEHSLILVSTSTGCVFHFCFCFLVGISIGITSSATGWKGCVRTAGIKTYKLINKNNKKKHDQIISLVKSKLNCMKVLISKALIDSNISHEGFLLINNVLKV